VVRVLYIDAQTALRECDRLISRMSERCWIWAQEREGEERMCNTDEQTVCASVCTLVSTLGLGPYVWHILNIPVTYER